MANEENKKRAAELVEKTVNIAERHDWESVNALMDEAILLDPENDFAWYNRGTAKGNLGQHGEALKDFDKAIDLNPNNDKAWGNRGWAYYHLDDLGKAQSDFMRALGLNPNSDFAQRGLLAVDARRLSKEETQKIEDSVKGQAELFTGFHDEMMAKQTKAEYAIRYLNRFIIGAWMFLVLIVLTYFFIVFWPSLNPKDSGIISELILSPFRNLLIISAFLMLIFPFIWGIRMLMTARDKQEILREDYYRRAWIDATIRRVFAPINPADDSAELKALRYKVWQDYITEWSHHSPAEMMLQYRSKGGGASTQSTEIIRKVIPGQDSS